MAIRSPNARARSMPASIVVAASGIDNVHRPDPRMLALVGAGGVDLVDHARDEPLERLAHPLVLTGQHRCGSVVTALVPSRSATSTDVTASASQSSVRTTPSSTSGTVSAGRVDATGAGGASALPIASSSIGTPGTPRSLATSIARSSPRVNVAPHPHRRIRGQDALELLGREGRAVGDDDHPGVLANDADAHATAIVDRRP